MPKQVEFDEADGFDEPVADLNPELDAALRNIEKLLSETKNTLTNIQFLLTVGIVGIVVIVGTLRQLVLACRRPMIGRRLSKEEAKRLLAKLD